MNYSNRITVRPLSICDARYTKGLLHSKKNSLKSICHLFEPKQCVRPEKNEPARLARGGFWSPLALPATDFLVRRAHDAPLFNTCHHAPQHPDKPLFSNDYLNKN